MQNANEGTNTVAKSSDPLSVRVPRGFWGLGFRFKVLGGFGVSV